MITLCDTSTCWRATQPPTGNHNNKDSHWITRSKELIVIWKIVEIVRVHLVAFDAINEGSNDMFLWLRAHFTDALSFRLRCTLLLNVTALALFYCYDKGSWGKLCCQQSQEAIIVEKWLQARSLWIHTAVHNAIYLGKQTQLIHQSRMKPASISDSLLSQVSHENVLPSSYEIL